MAITNINAIQSSLSYLSTYTDEYIKESLSNLGQRFSVKGDGIQTGEFSLYEIFDRNYDEDENLYSYVKANITKYDNEIYGITLSYNDGISGETIETLSLDGISYLVTSEDISVTGSDTYLGTSYYASGGVINKNTNLYIDTFSCLDDDGNITSILSESFYINNTSSISYLYEGVKFFEYDNYIYGLHIQYDEDTSYYIGTIYKSTWSSTIGTLNEWLFSNNYLYSNIEGTTPSSIIADLIGANNFIEIMTNENDEELILTLSVNSNIDGISFDIPIDSGDSTLDAIIEGVGTEFNYDCNTFDSQMREYYNSKVFFSSSDTLALKKQLLIKICTTIYDDTNAKTDYDNLIDVIVYFPYDYKFIYSCNDNNQSKIHNSIKDITVEFTNNISDDLYKIIGESSQQLVLVDASDTSSDDDKYSLYFYQITYSIDDIVDDINVEQKYTLPYINKYGYWCINDITTDIYAKGKDGGQPSLIITYTDTLSNTNELLSSFQSDEISSLSWELTYYLIKPIGSNIGESEYHLLQTYIPTSISYLDDNLISFLESAMIMNINSVNSEVSYNTEYSLPSEIGSNSVITTFWVLEKTESGDEVEYSFAYIKQPSSPFALDFNTLNNTEGVVQYYVNQGTEPDTHEHSWVVFDKLSTSFKNSSSLSNIKVWPVIMNQDASFFSSMLAIDNNDASGVYINNLNFILGFFDNITKNSDNGIYSVGQNDDTSPYLTIGSDNKIYSFISYKKYENEWVPNAWTTSSDGSSNIDGIIPIFELSEVLTRNVTVLNRLNLFITDKDGYVYNSYIGSSYDSSDKSILHIGTSPTNINLGEVTLTDEASKSYFKTQTGISIDFDNIYINGVMYQEGSLWTSSNDLYYNNIIASDTFTYDENIFDVLSDSASFDSSSDLFFYKQVEICSGRSNSNYTIPSTYAYISYLNLNLFIENLQIPDSSDLPLIVSGDNSKIYYGLDSDNIYSYTLELSTDITDEENQIINSNTIYIVTNPIAVNYKIIDETLFVNVKENVTTTSKNYEINNGQI